MPKSYEINPAVTNYIQRVAAHEVTNAPHPIRKLVEAGGVIPTEQVEQAVGASPAMLREMGLNSLEVGPVTIFPEVRTGVLQSENHR